MNKLSLNSNISDQKEIGVMQINEASMKSQDPAAQDKLKESEVRYRRLFESAQDGILILNFITGAIVDANPFILKLIDFPIEKILGKRLWEIGLFTNKEESEQAFIELKLKRYMRFENMPLLSRNGKITEVEFISNVYIENNTSIIQCNIRDITVRIKSESALLKSDLNLKKQNKQYAKLNIEYSVLNEELKENIARIQHINNDLIIAKEKAEESEKLKSAFLSNLSHEIRTPMNAILGFSEIILQPELSRDKLEEYIKIINSSSHQLLSVISDIIDISKIEANQFSVNLELIDIKRVMIEIFETYKKTVDTKKIRLNYRSLNSPKPILLKTDENRIRQVICNLLNNAIKYTKEGEIQFGYTIQEDSLEFFVKDSGIGIESENLGLIFQRFRQVEGTREKLNEGNGLGLSISKALVEKLGGTIQVFSEFGKGSAFVFTHPYGHETKDRVSEITEPVQHNWHDETILIVEDEIYNHAFFKELISHANAGTLHALNGRQAVDLVKSHPEISLVLMNIKMPGMDGYETMQRIKKIRPTLTVIAQTAYANMETKQKALDSGFDNYLIKPIDSSLLMDLLNSYFTNN